MIKAKSASVSAFGATISLEGGEVEVMGRGVLVTLGNLRISVEECQGGKYLVRTHNGVSMTEVEIATDGLRTVIFNPNLATSAPTVISGEELVVPLPPRAEWKPGDPD